jgi:acetoin utilization protein AcuB
MELKTDLVNSKDSQQPMFVEKWMTAEPQTIPPDMTISTVALEMSRCKFRHFPVVEPTRSGGRLVGIVAKYDIARGFPYDLNPFSVEVTEDSVPKPVSSVMTRKVITATPGCPIEEAARLLRSNRIGSLPILRDNQLVGIITESDLFEAFISMTAAKSGGTRIFIESDFNDSPIPAVLEFCRKNRVDILSMMAFHENRLRRRDMSIFRFDGRLPSGFVTEMAALGYRVVSVE